MNIRKSGQAVGLLCATALLSSSFVTAQDQRGDWPLNGGDSSQSGWQKDEQGLTPESAAAKFTFLWKLKLGQPSGIGNSFSEPLLAGRLINAQGFKDIVYWSSGDTLYAVDSELGSLIWKKQYALPAARSGCAVSSLGLLMEPPAVINFAARRKRPPGTPRPPDPPAAKTTERRLGMPPGGGYFGLKGIYVLTPDGMLHEQVMTTGADFAAPVKFLPAANGSTYGLNFFNKTIITSTANDCAGVPDGAWSIDLKSVDYPVLQYTTEKIHPLSLSGPMITTEGTSIFVTGAGTSDAGAGVYAGSIVALSKDLKPTDWFTPEGGMAAFEAVSPVSFDYQGKLYVVAPGKDGAVALLDAASLGGADHHTPLFQTAALTRPGQKHAWDGFATWTDKDGVQWVYASISSGLTVSDNTLKQGGTTTHGGVIAFKVGAVNGKLGLTPVWVSPDMINPAPPRIANGVVVALSGGDASTHARLYVMNAATGAQLYSSNDEIPTYTHLSGVAVGDSHAIFTDRNNVLYSFGLPLEH